MKKEFWKKGKKWNLRSYSKTNFARSDYVGSNWAAG